jgi:2-polyprenyl-6-hydroxyphenyl methylase / 3-demethylubiquinone-9 3-methyltransferase
LWGGFLTEAFAHLGSAVVGVDPSEVSIATARAHAQAARLAIEYLVGAGEQLPFPSNDFDLVTCCDVLEHVNDLDAVVGEIARVLKPGGVFCYDTVNRTWQSKLLAIKIVQEWRVTRIIDFRLHDWTMFITPQELLALFACHGFHNHALVGLRPNIGQPLALLRDVWRLKRGALSYGELGRHVRAVEGGSLRLSYMGYATKE